ncbi:MAG: hypothetical protein CMH54_15315 [Myxococcales bacterium]|nr:hypothetical protein [Myxococcales bacterium]|tara:strand:- start:684 stop:1625 length:942 start_codon:yes stop_codon:yes gene_type:complete
MHVVDNRLLERFLAVMFLIVASVTLFGPTPRKQADMEARAKKSVLPTLHTWPPPVALIKKQLAIDTNKVKDFSLSKADRELLAKLAILHRIEFETHSDGQNTAYQKASKGYTNDVEWFVRDYGVQHYVLLGVVQQHRFMTALRSLLRKKIRGEKADSELAVIHELAGTFLNWAVGQGIIPRDGKAGEQELFLAATLFKVRWLKWASRIEDANFHLTRIEKRTVLAYQVESFRGLPAQRRLNLLVELEQLDEGYPGALARGLILTQIGRLDKAKSVVDTALKTNPGDRRLQKLKSFLKRTIPTARRGQNRQGRD